MRISFIGSGNVATHFALAMYNRGHVIDQIYSRDLSHAQYLANRVEAEPVNSFDQLRYTSNIYILAVTDDALYDVVLDLHLDNALVLHTSGSVPIKVLKKTSSRYGVIWSPQSFVRDVAIEYNQLPFCIEGSDEKTEEDIAEFIGMISPHIYHTTFQQRQYLHLSSVFVNNFTNALYAVAQQLCKKHKTDFEILYPLILTTAKRVQWGDVKYQLTGPAVRGDEKTLNAQRKLLAKDPTLLSLYNELTDILQNLK